MNRDPKPIQDSTLAEGLIRIGAEAIAKQNVFHGPDGDATLEDLKPIFAAMRNAFTAFSGRVTTRKSSAVRNSSRCSYALNRAT
jgi:hypothetical protein